MIRIIGSAISVCLSVLLPAAVVARTLSVSAGKIASGVMVGPEDTELSLVGNVNAADLHHIALNCRSLRSLDLSGVDIAQPPLPIVEVFRLMSCLRIPYRD